MCYLVIYIHFSQPYIFPISCLKVEPDSVIKKRDQTCVVFLSRPIKSLKRAFIQCSCGMSCYNAVGRVVLVLYTLSSIPHVF